MRNIKMFKEGAALIKDLNLLVLGDLHLGYEGILAESGLFIPKIQLKKIMQNILNLKKESKVDRILINGDLKHEFSSTTYHEYKDLDKFLEFLTENFEDIILIKGNHDNFIHRITMRYGIEPLSYYEEDDYFFTHGHKYYETDKFKILSHEHPTVSFYFENTKIKLKVFLYSEDFLVLPAFSPLMQGLDYNFLSPEDVKNEYLRNYDFEHILVYGIFDEEVLFLGDLASLSKLSKIEL